MKTRGLQNALNRLGGARKLGSPMLLARAEEEARHAVKQAHAWMERRPVTGQPDALCAEIRQVVQALEAALAEAPG